MRDTRLQHQLISDEPISDVMLCGATTDIFRCKTTDKYT